MQNLHATFKCYIIFTLYRPFNLPAEGQTTVEELLLHVCHYYFIQDEIQQILAAGIAFTSFLTVLNTALQQRAEQVKTVTEQLWIHPMEQLHCSNQTPPFEVAAYQDTSSGGTSAVSCFDYIMINDVSLDPFLDCNRNFHIKLLCILFKFVVTSCYQSHFWRNCINFQMDRNFFYA